MYSVGPFLHTRYSPDLNFENMTLTLVQMQLSSFIRKASSLLLQSLQLVFMLCCLLKAAGNMYNFDICLKMYLFASSLKCVTLVVARRHNRFSDFQAFVIFNCHWIIVNVMLFLYLSHSCLCCPWPSFCTICSSKLH